MSSIVPNVVTSVVQAQLTQQQRSAEADAPRAADARKSIRSQQQSAAHREFVEDLAAAAGRKVDEEEKNPPKRQKKKRLTPAKTVEGSEDQDRPSDLRAHAAALLADPEEKGTAAPPPLMLDIEA